MRRLFFPLVAALTFTGCNDQLLLQSLEGDVSLSYTCSSFESVAGAEAELDLLEELSMTAYRHAMGNGRATEAAHLPLLRAERQLAELERAVVEYFCENRSALAAERVPIIRGPITTDSIAPEFSLPALVEDAEGQISEGSTLTLSSLRGRVVVVHMLATWCPPCQTGHQDLVEYIPDAPAGVDFLGIVTHDTPRIAVEWLRKNGGLPFTTLKDHRNRMANRYGIRAFPQLYVVAADGRVAFHSRGTTSMEELDAVLASLTTPDR